MVRQHQTSDVQLHIGESRDSGFDAPHRPGMTASGLLRRFSLRNDKLTYVRVLAARCVRVLAKTIRPEIQRAQGIPGAQCARSLVCEKNKHTSIVTTVTPEITRHSPRNGFTAYFALSPVTRLV